MLLSSYEALLLHVSRKILCACIRTKEKDRHRISLLSTILGASINQVLVVRLDRVDQKVHIVKGFRILCNIFNTRGNARDLAARRISTPGRFISVVAAECDVEDLVNVSIDQSMSKKRTDHLHLLPGRRDVTTTVVNKLHHWRAPVIRVGCIALDVSWNIRPGEVPYPDTICFNLCSPDATAFLVEGITEGALRSSDAAASVVKETVGFGDFADRSLRRGQDALGGLGIQRNLILGEF